MKIDPISLRVNQLEMTDFRGFKRCSLEFSKDIQTTVFVGANGAGKTSILDSVAILLSWLIARLKPKDNPKIENRGLLPSNDDVRIGGHDYLSCHISLGDHSLDYELTHYMIDGDAPGFPQELFDFSKNLRIKILNNAAKVSVPLVVYYRTNRIVNEIPLEFQADISYNQFNAYDDALEAIIDFHAFFKWYRNQEDYENEVRSRKDSSYKDRFLMAVKNAVTQFSSLEGFTNLEIRRLPKPESMVVTKEIEKNTQELKLNQLSDGEKCLIAMIADIARRLAIANPGLDDPLQGHGVVLIDEIELHLHPKWQRTIIPDLEKTFPNVQFIVTTHSPQVLSHVKSESIIFLEQTQDGIIAHEPTSLYGRDHNQILERFMGVDERPTKIKKDLQRLFRLIDQGELEKAKKLRKKLEKQIGFVDDFLTADALIKRKELIGK